MGLYIMNIHFLNPRRIGLPLTALAVAVMSVNAGANSVSSDAMDTITVTAQAANARSAIERQRNSDKVVAVQTSEAIGQLPDANVSEALQRMPGVFIERDQGEGRFVGIRGIDPNLNAASINGLSIPAPEGDRRSVALDVIPSDLLSSLEVYKTLTPDMSADSIGGAIEIKSLNALEQDGQVIKFSVENGYGELQGKHSPKLSGTFSDVFELDGRQLGVAFAVSWQERNFGSENIEGDPWEEFTAADGSEAMGVAEIEQRDYSITRERTGLALNLDYRLSDEHTVYLRSLYSDYSDDEQRQSSTYVFDEENDEPNSISGTSASWSDAALEKELKDRYEEQSILSLVLGGEHSLDQWHVEYALGYSKSDENEPNARYATFIQEGLELGYDRAGKKPNLVAEDAAFDASAYELDEIVVGDNYTQDRERSFRLDIRRELELAGNRSEIQFGLQERRREKNADFNEVTYSGFGDDYTLAQFVKNDMDYGLGNFGPGISRDALRQFIASNLHQFEIDETDTALDSARDFTIEENVSAFYLMNRIEFERANLVYGLRYERTDMSSAGFRVVESEEPIEGAEEVAEDVYVTPVSYQRDYGNLFPSVNFKYDLSDNMVLRAAYTESLSRPAFGYLNPSPEAIEYDDGELEVEAGNPHLKPYEAQNLDVSFEYYADSLGVFSVGAFHKNIDNFIVVADVSGTADFTQYVGNLPVEDAEILQPINGRSAKLTGGELAWTRAFDNGLLLMANATLTDSRASLGLGPDAERSDRISLPQQADLVGNFIVGYERDALSLRLSLTHRGERLVEVDMESADLDLYEDSHTQVDFSAKYKLDNGLQVFFNAVNLTDEPYYAKRRGFNAQYEEYGPVYVLGVSFSSF